MSAAPSEPDPAASGDARGDLELLIRGFMVSCALRVLADLRVADHIGCDERVPLEALASAVGARPGRLLRVLRATAAQGVFTVAVDGTIGHTPRSILLRTDHPDSAHYSARFWAAPGSWAAWGKLDAALDGGVPHEAAWGHGRFAYLREHPAEARGFDEMMAHMSDNRHSAVANAVDFSGCRLIADIGGGNGATLRHILARFPGPNGIVLDRPDVVAAIPREQLLDGRISPLGGSFFDAVPAGADAYILSRVLHDWPDEECCRILAACRAAMGPAARLLVVEQLLETDPLRGKPVDYLIDLQMMAMFGGGLERTEGEFRSLFAANGFALQAIIPTASPLSVLEARLI